MLNLRRWIVLLFAATVLAGNAGAERVRILVREGPISIESNKITIGSVAIVTGGPLHIRRRISSLDLEDIKDRTVVHRINRRQVELRIRVDGIAKADFEILGSEEVAVRGGQPGRFKQDLESEISAEIARQFGFQNGTVDVQLLSKQQMEEVSTQLSTSKYTTMILLPSQLPLGKNRLRVDFLEQNGRRFSKTFDCEVIVEFKLALATEHIPRGTKITQAMLREVTRPVSKKEQYALSQHAVGLIAKRDIASNQVLLTSYLSNIPEIQKPLVRRQRPLDVIIRLGNSEIRLKNAKALEDGRIGDLISILNTRSNKRLYARVVGPSLAVAGSGGAN